MITSFLLTYGERLLLGLVFVGGAFLWFKSPLFVRRRFLWVLAIIVLGVRILFAVWKTYEQYLLWKAIPFTQLFLPPHRSWSYFAQYAGSHFWLEAGLSVLAAVVAYLFLWGLQRYRERFFEGGEAELGLLLCLIVGWPGVLVFIAGTCLGIILVSIIRQLWLAQSYTTLGIPMLIGGLLAFALSPWLISVLGLSALNI